MNKVSVLLIAEEREVFVRLTVNDLVRITELLQEKSKKNNIFVEFEYNEEVVSGMFAGFVVLGNDLIPENQYIYNLIAYK